MLDCLIIGDSIAVGTHAHRPDCVAYAKGGWNTWQWNRDFLKNDLTASTVIISLGSNDHKGVKTYDELRKMRAKVKATKVFWILPNGNLKASGVPIEIIQHLVKEVAAQYGDVVLPITAVQADNIHPSTRGYKQIAASAK